MIVAFWDREEDGLLGSLAYTQSPLVPLADTVGYVNFDIQGANLLPALRNTTFAVGAESGGTRFQDIVRAAADPQSLDTNLLQRDLRTGAQRLRELPERRRAERLLHGLDRALLPHEPGRARHRGLRQARSADRHGAGHDARAGEHDQPARVDRERPGRLRTTW